MQRETAVRGVTGLLATVLALLFAAPAAARGPVPPCVAYSFEGSGFTVCAFDSRQHELRLLWTDAKGAALRSFARAAEVLGHDAGRVRFAMNAGMFQDDGMPLGLYIEAGRERRPLNTRDAEGNFYLKPNGVFSLDGAGTVRIETADAFAARHGAALFATQSGPMLLIGGKLHPLIAADGPSQNIRNGVGVQDGHSAFFVISDGAVSFGRLARFFRDVLHCPDALYFDGSISSAWIPAQSRKDGAVPLGPMVVVLDRR